MYRRLLSSAVVAVFLIGIRAQPTSAANVEAAKSNKTARGARPSPLDSAQAAAIWHSLLSRPVSHLEMLSMFGVNMSAHDEFSQWKVFKKTRAKLDARMHLVNPGARFTISVKQRMGEYDFAQKGFPVAIPSGQVPLPLGNHRYDTPSCNGFNSETAIYHAAVSIPSEISFIPLPESTAEGLMSRLQRERVVELTFTLEPRSAEEQREAMSDETPHFTCGLVRVLGCEIKEVRAALPALENNFSGPAVTAKVLRTWKF